jgi:hypothetical protein
MLACRLVFTILLLSLQLSLFAQSPKERRDRLKSRKAFTSFALPATLVGAGVLTMGDKNYFSSRDVHGFFQREFPGAHTKVDDITWIAPAIAVYGLNISGIKGKNNFVDRTIMYSMSTVLANTVSLTLKDRVDWMRPDGSTNNSFPSGHTTNAFVAAEFLHQEYKHISPWYSVAGYSLATATALMRIYNNRHWMSDVLAGAGIGMAATKASYFLYPKIKEQFKGKGKEMNAVIVPFYGNNAAGISAVYIIR